MLQVMRSHAMGHGIRNFHRLRFDACPMDDRGYVRAASRTLASADDRRDLSLLILKREGTIRTCPTKARRNNRLVVVAAAYMSNAR